MSVPPCSAQTPPLVLTFAASDPTGGAGLQADLLSISANGCHPLSVVTALTIQNSVGVAGIQPVDPEWVREQACTVLREMPVSVFKISVLGSVNNIAVIASILSDYPEIPVVFDPVLASGRGDAFVDGAMVRAFCKFLLPRTTVLTPNIWEAESLAKMIHGSMPGDLDDCARCLLRSGCRYVLLTGTHHSSAAVVNRLYGQPDRLLRSDSWSRLSASYHGSGCTLAAAIAAFVARGIAVEQAVWKAQAYTWQALSAGFRPAAGQHLPQRLFHLNTRDTVTDV